MSELSPGTHPSHVTKVVRSLRGGNIKLTAAVSGEERVDIWGQLEGSGNPLYPPRDPDKSVAKHGGVDGYKNSPARQLFHHITVGQYLSFAKQAREYFELPSPLYKGTAKSWEWAVGMAEEKLGKITGHGSDSTVCYAQAGWCKLEWLDDHQELKSEGLPTIELPRRFQIVRVVRSQLDEVRSVEPLVVCDSSPSAYPDIQQLCKR